MRAYKSNKPSYNNKKPGRPYNNNQKGYGSSSMSCMPQGGSVSMWTNHFNISLNTDLRIYQLCLKTKPELPQDKKFLFDKLVEMSLPMLEKLLGKENVNFFRSSQIIYSIKDLGADSADREVKLEKFEHFELVIMKTGEEFQIKEAFENSKVEPEVIRFLNIVMSNHMETLGYKNLGQRSTYYPTDKKPILLSKGISILPGFKATLDKYLDKTFKVNIDTCFRISSTYNIFKEFNDYVKEAHDKDRARAQFVEECIVGKSFSVKNDLNKMVKINGIDANKRLSSPSPVDGYKTMKEYLEHKYETVLKEPTQFILYREFKKKSNLPGAKPVIEKTYYPSEILFGLGLKDHQKKDWQLMKEVAEVTKMSPDPRRRNIIDCSKNFLKIAQGSALQMGIESSEGLNIQCKVLPPPDYQLRNNTKKAKDGIMFFKDEIFSNQARLDNWAIIYETNDDYVNNVYTALDEECSRMGINLVEPYYYQMPFKPKFSDYEEAIQEVKSEGCDFILFIFNKNTSQQLYKKIKGYCDTKAQILTQVSVFNPKIFSKKGYFEKLVHQMCSKLGFPLWIVQKPKGLLKTEPETMIIGADVYHSRGKDSVGAVIGTTNSDFSRFVSLSKTQPKKGQEIMTQVAEMVTECVETYQRKNKSLPKRVLFYRDGVGDQMIDLVQNNEISMIKKSFETKFGKDAPKLTMILVTKRISSKLLPISNGGSFNPKSGTIVSSTIVKKELDYFMVAQNVTQGTATPTRYQVLLNECEFSGEVLHEITYFQTFNYYGWTGAVRVPAVCQYAHKLAYHVGENYKQTNQFMKDYLYYL